MVLLRGPCPSPAAAAQILARRVKVSNNQIVGGHIFCTDVEQLTIQNNTVQVTNLGNVQRIPVHIALGGDSVVITGNLLKNDDSATKSVISLEGTREVKHALVANNLCFGAATVFSAFRVMILP